MWQLYEVAAQLSPSLKELKGHEKMCLAALEMFIGVLVFAVCLIGGVMLIACCSAGFSVLYRSGYINNGYR